MPADRQAINGSEVIHDEKGTLMILATTKVEDVDRFLDVFGTKGAEKRAQHGSKGATVFRDPTEANRVWALFEWDEQGWAAFVSDPDVPPILKEAGTSASPSWRLSSVSTKRRGDDDQHNRSAGSGRSHQDQTGALSFMGIANVNVAGMVIDDINSKGGLLGRPVELFIEDSATDDDVARAAAAQLVEADVDVVVGGIYSSTREAIKVPVVDEAGKLYIYPEQYEGQECHPLIFCTGPVPAQQVEPLFPWLMRETGAATFYMPSADYIWPRTLNKKVREVVTARGGEIVGERYFPLDHVDYESVVADIMATGADVVFNTIVPPGLTPFLAQLHEAGFIAGWPDCLHLLRRELLEFGACRSRRRARWLSRLLPGRTGSVQHRPSQPVRGPVPRQRNVHGRLSVHRYLSGIEDVGVRREGGGLSQAARHHRRPGPRPHPAGAGRTRRDGARPAPRSHEHVHRTVRERHVQGGREPRSHRSQGVRDTSELTWQFGSSGGAKFHLQQTFSAFTRGGMAKMSTFMSWLYILAVSINEAGQVEWPFSRGCPDTREPPIDLGHSIG